MEDLWDEVDGRSVLMGVNLERAEIPDRGWVKGRIEFRVRDITGLSPDERARIGLGMAMQMPPRLKGIGLGDLLKRIARMRGTLWTRSWPWPGS